MEFWGIEVKAGQPIKTDPGASYIIHLSQASLGESKNKAESVPLYVNANGKKLVLGTLSHQNCPQLTFDLVFDQDFELSHNWKNGSVYFIGYRTFVPEEGTEDEFDTPSEEESSEEEEVPVAAAENGKTKIDTKTANADTGIKIAEPGNNKKTEDDDDESGSDEDDDSEDEDESDEMSMDEGSDDEDEETPKKVESSKKRSAEATTPVSAKKAKSAATPQKTDGKKGGHAATPHPSKQAGKNSAKSPKSGGQFSCGSCNKSFGSEGGLESHKKAKHGGK
ncbi:histone deacetylase HDT1-like isoform X1 [Durio zibethinus]|uniref:Histone deacetylase HDT1-like isoform X1 n=1 Tax=Durio zibethinus TaxID=66656 RepID=A0A6P5XU93_DURZI|nr:histone deacetylase HDT1-like isoform X1 [Durio zibethinus]